MKRGRSGHPRLWSWTLLTFPYSQIYFCLYIYVWFAYIYICMIWDTFFIQFLFIHRQAVSLYHNSSLWLDTWDASSWDWDLPNYMLDLVSYHPAISRTWPLAKWVECSPMDRETGVQSQAESRQRLKKWCLIPPWLALSTIRWGSRVKWGNPRKA